MNRSSRTLVVLIAVISMLGCSLPDGSVAGPEAAYYKWVSARANADIETTWELLSDEAKKQLNRWVALERKTDALLNTKGINPKTAQAVRASLKVATLKDGKALYARLIGGPSEALGMMVQLGAHVRTTHQKENLITLTTWAGDRVQLRAVDDDRFVLLLPQTIQEVLVGNIKQAEKNLAQTEAHLAKLKSLKWPSN